MKSFLYKFIPVISAVLLLTGCSGIKNSEPYYKSGVCFDTVITISIYDAEGFDSSETMQKVLNGAFAECERYDDLFSRTKEGSDIYRINHAKGESVKVDEETATLINDALSYCAIPGSKADITIAPLKELWQQSNESIPDKEDIREALTHVNYKKVKVKGNEVTLLDPDAAIDLGFIAKGYVADRLKEYLVSKGVTSAVIDLGGNVACIGKKPDGSKFTIGIKMPFTKTNEIEKTVEVNDKSVVTSGIYERYFTVDDVIYHHVLNPLTGYPSDNDLSSVTIIADSSEEADALSTICLLNGESTAKQILEAFPDVEVIFLPRLEQK